MELAVVSLAGQLVTQPPTSATLVARASLALLQKENHAEMPKRPVCLLILALPESASLDKQSQMIPPVAMQVTNATNLMSAKAESVLLTFSSLKVHRVATKPSLTAIPSEISVMELEAASPCLSLLDRHAEMPSLLA